MLKFSLMLMGLAFLTVGILWQNGYVDPLPWIDFVKQVTPGRVKHPIKKEIPKQIIPKSAVSSPIEPKPRVAEATPVTGDKSSEISVKTSAKGTLPPGAAPSEAPKSTAAKLAPVQMDKTSGAPVETIVKEMPSPGAAPSATPRPRSAKVTPARKDRPSAVPVQTGAKGTPAAMTGPDMEVQQRVAQGAAMPEGGVSGGPSRRTSEGDAALVDEFYAALKESDITATATPTMEPYVERRQVVPRKTNTNTEAPAVEQAESIAKGKSVRGAEPPVALHQEISREGVLQTPEFPFGPKETPTKRTTIAKSKTSSEPKQTMAADAVASPPVPSSVSAERAVQGAAVAAVSTSLEPKQGVDRYKALFETENPPDNPKSYPYSLYFGSFRTLERAKKAVSIYRKKGLSPYWVKVLLSSGFWYRVYAGHFEGAEQAENFRQENRLPKTEVRETPYANLIGTYTSRDELEDMISSLKDRGFSPYVIKDDGKSRLFIGAFLPIERAERTYRVLDAGGIRNRIVNR